MALFPIHGKMQKTNVEFWKNKLERNQVRDWETSIFYQEKGWNILRIWEHEIRKEFDQTMQKIVSFIEGAKERNHLK